MKRLNICRTDTILCGLLAIIVHSRPDMTIGEKRQDATLAQSGWPTWVRRLLNGNGSYRIVNPFSVVKHALHLLISGLRKRTRSVVDKRILVSGGWLIVILLTGFGGPAWSQCFAGGYSNKYEVTANNVYGATDVAMGDFNKDGRPDMAIGRPNEHLLSVVYGQAAGGFSAPNNIKVGNTPNAVAVGDFNGDGKPDLVVANAGSENVRVLLNNSVVGFSLGYSVDTPLGFSPASLAVGDFNGDGKDDLVVTNPAADQVSVLLGTDFGDFLSPNAYAVGDSPWSVAVGDFNGDGKPDLAVANFGAGKGTGSVSILISKGILGFGSAFTIYVGDNPEDLAVGDFNVDGKLDLAVTNRSPGNVMVLLNNGVGTFISSINYAVGYGPNALAVGDINGDGKPDLSVANNFSNSVSVLLNTGSGAFAPATNYGTGVNSAPVDVAISDVNSDGKPDVVVVLPSLTRVKVMLQHICLNTHPFKVINMPTLKATLGQPFNYTIPSGYFSDTETPDKLTYLITNLPAGLVFTAPATISGTPLGKAGQFSANIKVTDPEGFALTTGINFLITNAEANNQAPTVNKAIPDQLSTQGQDFIYIIAANTFTDAETPNNLTLSVTGLPAGLAFTAPATIRGTPSTLLNSPFQITVTATDPRGLSVSTTFLLVVQAQPLLLLAPLYNCQTGALTFQTTGGDGSKIEYMALNKTGWISNPNQILDRVLLTAAYANPLTLKARQSGQEVTYSFDIRVACPADTRGRLTAEAPSPEVILLVLAYPNPVQEDFTVAIEGAGGQVVRLWLVDGQGRTLVDRQINVVQTQHREPMSIGQHEPGMYLLRVSTAGQARTLKVLQR